MKYLITDEELLAYVNGSMAPTVRKELEKRACRTGQTDILLNVLLADYACCEEDANVILNKNVHPLQLDQVQLPVAANKATPKKMLKAMIDR